MQMLFGFTFKKTNYLDFFYFSIISNINIFLDSATNYLSTSSQKHIAEKKRLTSIANAAVCWS